MFPPDHASPGGLAGEVRETAEDRSHTVRFRYAVNKRTRHAIDWWTFMSVREDNWAHQAYEQHEPAASSTTADERRRQMRPPRRGDANTNEPPKPQVASGDQVLEPYKLGSQALGSPEQAMH